MVGFAGLNTMSQSNGSLCTGF